MCAGTEICNAPVHQMTTILLTNRCYPVKTGNLGVNIEHARQHFNNAALQVFTTANKKQVPQQLHYEDARATQLP